MRQTGSGEVPDYAFYTCIPQQVKPDLGILYLGRLELPDQKWTFTDICSTVLVFLHLAFNFKEADLGYFVYKLQ